MWTRTSGDLMTPEPAVLAQSRRTWHHARSVSCDERLALAMSAQVIDDLHEYRFSSRSEPWPELSLDEEAA